MAGTETKFESSDSSDADTHVTKDDIEEMVELETQIREEEYAVENEAADDQPDDDPFYKLDDDKQLRDYIPFLFPDTEDKYTTGTIATVTYENYYAKVKIHSREGPVTIKKRVDDISADDNFISDLCNFCGVDKTNLSDLQGKQIQLKRDSEDDNWDIHIPKTHTTASYAIFHGLNWIDKNIDKGQLLGGAIISIILLFTERSTRVLLTLSSHNETFTLVELMDIVGGPLFTASNNEFTIMTFIVLAATVLSMIGSLVIALIGMLLVVAVPYILVKFLHDQLKKRVWPY